MTDTQLAERQGLLEAVLDAPEDDGPRLVFADWCEDNGEPDRAEFVRIQCRIAQLELASGHPKTTPPAWSCKCDVCEEAKPLRRLERELWGGHTFSPPISHGFAGAIDAVGIPLDPSRSIGIIRRGFVEVVRAPLRALFDHGKAIVAAHPITRMEASDRQPEQITGPFWRWHLWAWDPENETLSDGDWAAIDDDPAALPVAVFHCLRNARSDWPTMVRYYDSLEAALDALSAALLELASRQDVTITPANPPLRPSSPVTYVPHTDPPEG